MRERERGPGAGLSVLSASSPRARARDAAARRTGAARRAATRRSDAHGGMLSAAATFGIASPTTMRYDVATPKHLIATAASIRLVSCGAARCATA